MLKVFASTESWQEKINCENKRAVPLMGASDGIRSSHVCAALRCPHLRQTHVVLISCIWTHSFTLRLHLFLPPKPRLCLFVHPISLICAVVPAALTATFLSFTIHRFLLHFSYPLPTSFLHRFTFFPFFFFLAVPFPCRFLSPEHISGLCTCHPVYLEIFEQYSYREAASVSLQDV